METGDELEEELKLEADSLDGELLSDYFNLNWLKRITAYDYNSPETYIRVFALRDLIFFAPSYALLLVQSFKQLQIEGIIGPERNLTFFQNATNPANPAIPISVLGADVSQVILAVLTGIGFMWHRLKNEPSKLGLIVQSLIAVAGLIYFLADVGINQLPYLEGVAIYFKDIALAIGGAGLVEELIRLLIQNSRKKIIFPRMGGEVNEVSPLLLGDRQSVPQANLAINYHTIARLPTLFFGSAAVITYGVKNIAHATLKPIVEQTPIALSAVQIASSGLAWMSYIVELVLDKKTPTVTKVTKGLIATSGLGWSISDALITSSPAAEPLQAAKGVFTCCFLLLSLTHLAKLLYEVVKNEEYNPCLR